MCGYCTISFKQPRVALGWGGEEERLEPVGDGDVEHRIDRVLAGRLGHLPNRHLPELLGLRRAGRQHGHRLEGRRGHVGRIVLQTLPASGIGELVEPFLERAGRRFHPRLGVVVEVPVFEGEREAGV